MINQIASDPFYNIKTFISKTDTKYSLSIIYNINMILYHSGVYPNTLNLLDLCVILLGISILPWGAVLKILSILFYTYGFNLCLTLIPFSVSSSCLGELAPVIAVETSGLLIVQAIASCAIVQFNSSANSLNLFKLYREIPTRG